ncbi:hypothetical protein [Halotia branconii]|uniref:Uncharacterized protein n=1 Tax=Halotia branconii CENA392 TaxID=1539056 RepID=A0AAJ6NMI6_9CYAN|nr:hypothetical protein [Halotia branconii]WGV23260.1 hypothetical protein QI031_15645 [Halotia branconii CENA392]
MQSDSNSPSPAHVASTNSNLNSRLLIPRSQRRRFFFQFTFMTVLGWVVGGITSIALERIILASLASVVASQPQAWSIVIRLLSTMVFAIVFSADQAMIVRRYLSGWRWMLATSAGWLIASSVATAWITYIASIAASLSEALTPEVSVILGFLSTISYIISGIWLGLFQWLVLRRYTAGAWWWNFLPSISFFCISLFVWLLSFGQNLIPEMNRTAILYWSEQGFTAVILGVIPAIGLCTLKRNSQRQTEISV